VNAVTGADRPLPLQTHQSLPKGCLALFRRVSTKVLVPTVLSQRLGQVAKAAHLASISNQDLKASLARDKSFVVNAQQWPSSSR